MTWDRMVTDFKRGSTFEVVEATITPPSSAVREHREGS